MWFWRHSQNSESELDSASLDNNICLYSEESSCVSEAAVTTFKVHVHPPMWKLSLGECFKGLYEYLIRAVNNFVYLKTKQNKTNFHLLILHPSERNLPTSHIYTASLKNYKTPKETAALCHVLNPDRN